MNLLSIPINLTTLYAIVAGFLLDAMLGDPQNPLHPIRLLGFINTQLLKAIRKISPKGNAAKFACGMVMSLLSIAFAYFLMVLLHETLYALNFWAGFIFEAAMCYFIIAARALFTEGRKIKRLLGNGKIIEARKQLSYIVGRDTDALDNKKIITAVVETIAENLSDGVIAPLVFMFIGGVPLAFAYKAVNTLDSMIGYNNDEFCYLGRFAARLDDVVNFIPARLSAVLMIVAAVLLGNDVRGAIKIYRRDRRNHLSPNSAHTEAVCAGALGLQLGGVNIYGGKPVEKPTIGDTKHLPTTADITGAGWLMYISGILAVLIGIAVALPLLWGNG